MLWDLAISNICKESNLILEFGEHTGDTITYFRNRRPAFYNFYRFNSCKGYTAEKGFFDLNVELFEIEGFPTFKFFKSDIEIDFKGE